VRITSALATKPLHRNSEVELSFHLRGRVCSCTSTLGFLKNADKGDLIMTAVSRTALITGASGGIGKALALRLAKDGFDIVAHYAGNSARAEELVAEIKRAGAKSAAIKADVAVAAEVENLFARALTEFDRLDVVVHTAGIMPLSPISTGDVDSFDRVIATNLRGTFLVLSQAAQHMASGGRIIALSSSVLAKSFPKYGAYIASKAGVEGLVHVLANELRGRNITVNAVAPGPTGTDLFLKGKDEGLIKELADLAPLERLGTPEDIAGVVSFLAGPDGAWVNSQVLRANGGFA
jgi:3-oxoacyl-[acyl-carrier protein] reductase